MLIPQFELSQTETHVKISIRAPYVKASEIDFVADGTEFRFFANPYFLRLNFPHELSNNEEETTAQYVIESHTVFFSLPKSVPNQYFEELDLVPKMLQIASPMEEEGSFTDVDLEKVVVDERKSVSSNNSHSLIQIPTKSQNIGFAGLFPDYLQHVPPDELYELFELDDPNDCDVSTRRGLREVSENLKFDEDYYISNFFDEEDEMQRIIDFVPSWYKEFEEIGPFLVEKVFPTGTPRPSWLSRNHNKADGAVVDNETGDIIFQERKAGPSASGRFDPILMAEIDLRSSQLLPLSESERSILTNLSSQSIKRERDRYHMAESKEAEMIFVLFGIVFGYCYDFRINEGETCTESAWNIRKLSPTLSFLDTPQNIKDACEIAICRSLSYPLFRSFELSSIVCHDVAICFALGKRKILKILLAVRDVFGKSDPCFRLNSLYIDDFILWIHYLSQDVFLSVSQAIKTNSVSKPNVRFDLSSIEQEALNRMHSDSDNNKYGAD